MKGGRDVNRAAAGAGIRPKRISMLDRRRPASRPGPSSSRRLGRALVALLVAFAAVGSLAYYAYRAHDQMGEMQAIECAQDGRIFLLYGPAVYTFLSDGTFLRTYTHPTISADAWSLAIEAGGGFYVGDAAQGRIARFSPEGNLLRVIQTPSLDGQAEEGYVDLAVGEGGNLFVVSAPLNTLFRLTSEGDFLYQTGGQGRESGQLNYPAAVAVGSAGLVYIADVYNRRIAVYTAEGMLSHYIDTRQAGKYYSSPTGLAVDRDRTLLASLLDPQLMTGNIVRFSPAGKMLETVVTGNRTFSILQDFCAGLDGSVYVLDSGQEAIFQFDPPSQAMRRFGDEHFAALQTSLAVRKTRLKRMRDVGIMAALGLGISLVVVGMVRLAHHLQPWSLSQRS